MGRFCRHFCVIFRYPVITGRLKNVFKTSFVRYGCLKDVSETACIHSLRSCDGLHFWETSSRLYWQGKENLEIRLFFYDPSVYNTIEIIKQSNQNTNSNKSKQITFIQDTRIFPVIYFLTNNLFSIISEVEYTHIVLLFEKNLCRKLPARHKYKA